MKLFGFEFVPQGVHLFELFVSQDGTIWERSFSLKPKNSLIIATFLGVHMDMERTQNKGTLGFNKGAFGFSVRFQGCNFLHLVATKKVASF